ncbi:MAG TPA: phosphotransferase [Baekduia sp.]|nr:phosphotransferase [Baekduia sp.]
MHTFRALVVDDQADIRELALDAGADHEGLEVLVAADLAEAQAILTENFVHVAFVDLQLGEGARINVDGMTVLKDLSDARPSAKRFLLTQYPTVYRRQLFQLLDPENPIIDGALDKDDFEHLFVDYVDQQATDWLRAPVEVLGIGGLLDGLDRKRLRSARSLSGNPVQTSGDELDYVIARLFGQGEPEDPDGVDDEIESVTLTPLTGGKSRSVVAAGVPLTRGHGEGIPCVVKVGARADAEEEIRRYNRYVRYRVALHRRVEVLSSCLGDTLGAVCYSFAGDDPGEITDLQTLLDAESPRAVECVETLFGEEAVWNDPGRSKPDLAGFFARAYGLDALRSLTAMRDFAKSRPVRELGVKLGDDCLTVGDATVDLLRDADLGGGRLRRRYEASIVHGDLNASNVIVADSGAITLIDFRHTTRGPASIDYAALQASIRLTVGARRAIVPSAKTILAAEKRLWREEFSASGAWWPEEAGDTPFWAQASAAVRARTIANLPSVSTSEHAATCLLYALRVFRVSSIAPEARLRLLIWISVLVASLNTESGAAQ